jgi:hypothetical protein
LWSLSASIIVFVGVVVVLWFLAANLRPYSKTKVGVWLQVHTIPVPKHEYLLARFNPIPIHVYFIPVLPLGQPS